MRADDTTRKDIERLRSLMAAFAGTMYNSDMAALDRAITAYERHASLVEAWKDGIWHSPGCLGQHEGYECGCGYDAMRAALDAERGEGDERPRTVECTFKLAKGDKPCGTCGGTEIEPDDNGRPRLIGQPCPACRPDEETSDS